MMRYVTEKWIDEIILNSPFVRPMDVKSIEVAIDQAHLRLPIRVEHRNVGALVHGGVIAAFAEIAGSVAGVSGIPDDDAFGCATSQLNITYLQPAEGAYLEAKACIAHRTARQTIADVHIVDDKDRAVAKATVICRIFNRESLVNAA